MIISVRQCLILFRKYSFIAIIFFTIITFILSKILIEWSASRSNIKCFTTEVNTQPVTVISSNKLEESNNSPTKQYFNDELISINSNNKTSNDVDDGRPNYRIHTFYYQWFPSERTELPQWRHWGQNYQPNWKEDRRIYPSGTHLPPHDIASNYYPQLGCYNSQNPAVIDTHMKQVREAGIGVVIVAWHPPLNSTDWDMDLILDTALRNDVKVAMHVSSYRDRNPINFRAHLQTWMARYGTHPALYRLPRLRSRGPKRRLPVFYIYDSYSTPSPAWREIFSESGTWNLSVRGTTIDAIFLALLVDAQHRNEIRQARFDGFYTYFASDSFTYGATWQNWKALARFARVNRMIFIPSVGPGYIDTQVRPWNKGSTRPRRHGRYYETAWQAALGAHVSFVSVTSFNEWHEGSQIEPAAPKSTETFTYLDYEPEGPRFYLRMTKKWGSLLRKPTPTTH